MDEGTTIDETKKFLRAELRGRLKLLSPTERTDASRTIEKFIFTSTAWCSAKTVALFCSRLDEPDTNGLMHSAWAEGKRVLCPKVTGDHLVFFEVKSQENLAPGAFGLQEPNEKFCLRVEPKEIDFILVPGLGFDKLGRRLGRGKGFYDSTLGLMLKSCPRVGTFFSRQEISVVPEEGHDVRLDVVVTEAGWLEI